MAAKRHLPVELGTLGINRYVHVECEPAFLVSVASAGELPEPGRSRTWEPAELLGQFPDIVSCDHCGVEFAATDSGYTSLWITTQKELDRIARGNIPTEVRLTWPWRLVAPAIASIGFAYPFLVRFVELRSLTRGDILPPVGVLLFAAGFWWYCAHRASIGESSATFHSPFRRRELRWDDVAAWTTTSSWITAVDRSGSRYRVSSYAAGGELLAARLRQALARRHGA